MGPVWSRAGQICTVNPCEPRWHCPAANKTCGSVGGVGSKFVRSSLLHPFFTSNLKCVVGVEELSFLHLGVSSENQGVIRKLDLRNIQVHAFIELCAGEVVKLDLQRRLLSWTKKNYDCCSACLNLELTP